MIVRKIIFHILTFFTVTWYRVLYGSHAFIGTGLSLRKDFNLMIAKGAKVSIGHGCFFNSHCTIDAESAIAIGDNCLFAENVKIYDNNHCFSQAGVPIKEQGAKSDPITIGNNCWLASNVVVLKGSNIGDNCVIGANCVVSGNIPAGSIVRCSQELDIEPIEFR